MFVKKLVIVLTSFVTLFTVVGYAGVSVHAESTNDNLVQPSSQGEYTEKELEELTNEIAEELEFYFSEIGEIDKHGKYTVTNPELLRQEINKGNPIAIELYQANSITQEPRNDGMISTLSTMDFIYCTVGEEYAWIGTLLSGQTVRALTEALASGAWTTAGKILARAALEIGPKVSKSVNLAFAAVSWSVSAYKCRGKF